MPPSANSRPKSNLVANADCHDGCRKVFKFSHATRVRPLNFANPGRFNAPPLPRRPAQDLGWKIPAEVFFDSLIRWATA
jgi:hypothetical protein